MEAIGSRRELLAVLKKRQMTILDHVMRDDGLENLTMTGRIERSRWTERPRKKYLDRVKELIGEVTTQQILNMMRDRE